MDWGAYWKRAGERAKGDAETGAVAGGLGAGAATGGLFAVPGAVIGGLGGAMRGWLFGENESSSKITATPEQSAAFEREKALRQEAIRQAQQMGGAAARDVAQQAALAYGGAGMAPAGGGRLAGLRDIGQGAEAARQQAALEATIFEQEASPEAARQKKMVWLTQQMESLRAAGRLPPEAVRGLLPMAAGDPQVVAYLNQQAATAPGKPSLPGDIKNAFEYIIGAA